MMVGGFLIVEKDVKRVKKDFTSIVIDLLLFQGRWRDTVAIFVGNIKSKQSAEDKLKRWLDC